MILLYLAMLVLAPAQASVPKATVLDESSSSVPVGELMKVYGFYLGQEKSLAAVEDKYPNLGRDVTIARAEFSSRFGPACDQVEARLRVAAGDQWPEVQQSLAQELGRLMGPPGTMEECRAGIQMVRERTKGRMESPFLELLLSQHPKYAQSPAREVADGFERVYESKGHPKSLGVNVKVVVPASWVAAEGERPHIVQKFKSEAGYGSMEVMLQIRPFPGGEGPLTKEEEAALFSEDGLKMMLPNCLERSSITLEGQPAGLVVYEEESERLSFKFYSKYMAFMVLVGDRLVSLQCGITSTADRKAQTQKEFDRARTLYMLIGNSMVLQDRYKK